MGPEPGSPAYLLTTPYPNLEYIDSLSAPMLSRRAQPILRYLAENYPKAPNLFPGDAANRATIDQKLIELDTQLGLLARRFGYTQLILECPAGKAR